MINKVLKKIAQDQVKRMLIVAPTWQYQVWYPTLLRMSTEKPLLLPHHPQQSTSSVKPPGSDKSVNDKQNIKISGLDGFKQRLLTTGILERASKLISSTRRQGSNQITIFPSQSGLTGVVKEKLIHFDVL